MNAPSRATHGGHWLVLAQVPCFRRAKLQLGMPRARRDGKKKALPTAISRVYTHFWPEAVKPVPVLLWQLEKAPGP
jgi:hypothetical protein